ncbi:hypothetical protein ACOQJS_24020, partial [Pseudocitrobacter faecalis]
VDGDIVLESSSRISLKVGGSFVVIHAGGVDIAGPKINLNGGGSTGTPVSTLQPTAIKALADEGDSASAPAERRGSDRSGSGNDSGEHDEPESEESVVRFMFS